MTPAASSRSTQSPSRRLCDGRQSVNAGWEPSAGTEGARPNGARNGSGRRGIVVEGASPGSPSDSRSPTQPTARTVECGEFWW
jgi:hypothetical protein